jgi:hypothetical protein
MALESTQPLTEISTGNLPGVKDNQYVKLTTSPPSVNWLCRKYRSLSVSQLYRSPWPVTRIGIRLWMWYFQIVP